jgi:putative nucleotidyltransferase with HDIG domain
MNTQSQDALMKKLEGLHDMPTLPVTLIPLLHYMEQPLDQLNLQEVVDLISQDKSLVAQCLHLANSPLFGRSQAATSIRDAIVALGFQRMRDIAVSCSVLSLSPKQQTGIDPVVFWEHSLGCALVSRQFARGIGFDDPNKAYLCGLLHDIGIVAHLWMIPKEFAQAMELARQQGIPLDEAETKTFGTSHAETGHLVARQWHLPAELVQVIAYHHNPAAATAHRDTVALVSLSDMLCRMSGIGHGIIERRQIDFLEEPGFSLLLQECPTLQNFDWARFTFELEGYLEEVHRLVTFLYRPK